MSDEPETAVVPDDDGDTGTRLIAISQEFSGPLPPPEMLAQYEDVVPGAAERIIVITEEQHRHRMSVETQWLTLIREGIRVEVIGQYGALVIAVAFAVVAIVMAITDRSWVFVPIGIPAFAWTAVWALRGIVRQPEDPDETAG